LSINGFTNRWNAEDFKRNDFFDTVRVCEWRPSGEEKLDIESRWREGRLRDFAILPLRKEFNEMARRRHYDFVLISYAYWANLSDEFGSDVVKIIDLHDFITLNLYISIGRGIFKFGRMFEEEIKAISKFNFALSISEEETLALSPFCPETKFVNAPIFFEPKFKKDSGHEFDLLFVGSDNPFNREGMSWFMKDIYPLLSPTVRIAVVGDVCKILNKKDNMVLIPHTDDLDEIYNRTNLAFCPLRGGTGLKVKVVEALSYGIPVITTSWGLSGIIQKYDNGCIIADNAKDFAKTVLYLLNNGEEYLSLKHKAESFFLRHFSSEACRTKLDKIFLDPSCLTNSAASTLHIKEEEK